MSSKGGVEIINVPNSIRLKVSGGGPISEEMIATADQAIEQLSGQFIELLRADIEKLAALSRDVKSGNGDTRQAIGEIFAISHELRGQGSTFEFPLVTRIGKSLCHFTENLNPSDSRNPQVIDLHVDSLRLVLVEDIRGDGGDPGRKIASGLEIAVKKVLG